MTETILVTTPRRFYGRHPDAIKLAAEAEVDPRTAAKFLLGYHIRVHAVRHRLEDATIKLGLRRRWRCEVCGAEARRRVRDVVIRPPEPEHPQIPTPHPDGDWHPFCSEHYRKSKRRVDDSVNADALSPAWQKTIAELRKKA
jgi:hypothetical protein